MPLVCGLVLLALLKTEMASLETNRAVFSLSLFAIIIVPTSRNNPSSTIKVKIDAMTKINTMPDSLLFVELVFIDKLELLF